MGARYDELQIKVKTTPSRVAVNAMRDEIKAYDLTWTSLSVF